MCLGLITSDGRKMDIFWFDPDRSIDQIYYLEVLQGVVKPWIETNYPNHDYVWQQGRVHMISA